MSTPAATRAGPQNAAVELALAPDPASDRGKYEFALGVRCFYPFGQHRGESRWDRDDPPGPGLPVVGPGPLVHLPFVRGAADIEPIQAGSMEAPSTVARRRRESFLRGVADASRSS